MAKDSQKSNRHKHLPINRQAVIDRQRRIVSSMYRPLCRIFILIGIATLLLAMVVVWQYRSSTKRTATTTGTITEVDKVSGVGQDEHGDSIQKCRIGYTVKIDGHDYTDVLGYRGDPTVSKCSLSVGQTIEVKYDPQHPSNNSYSIDDAQSDHGTLDQAISSAIGIGIVGLIPLVIGVLGLRIANKHREDQMEVFVDDARADKPKIRNKTSRSGGH